MKDNWIKKSYKDDLVAAGYDGLCYAASKYNQSMGASFSFIATNSIKNKMYHELKKIKKHTLNVVSLQKVVYDDCGDETTLEDLIPSDVDLEEEVVDSIFFRDVLKDVGEHFPERDNKLLKMWLYGMSYVEIGYRTYSSRSYVRYRLGRIFDYLREKYNEKY